MNKMWLVLEDRARSEKTLPGLKEMDDYLDFHGWHFNKKMCLWAVKRMVCRNGEPLHPITKENLEQMFRKVGLDVPIDYDHVYLANLGKATHMGSAIETEEHLVKYVIDNSTNPGLTFIRFYADCIGERISIPWIDLV